ncbi:MAG: tetratricopeptide repeat protein [Cyanobacteria bacterium REEB67]|nr:tetratricopeptide repeat protein [Cyanobacteria bacterium REEB67]
MTINRKMSRLGSLKLRTAHLMYGGFFAVSSASASLAQDQITNWGDGAERDPKYNIQLDGEGKIQKLGEYQQLHMDPIKSKSLDPKVAAKAYNNRAWIFRSTDRTRALADLDKAIELDPNYVRAYYNRVLTYTDLGDWRNVVKACDKMIELDPGCVVVYYHRAVAYGGLKQWQKAVDDCTTAIERNPRLATAYSYRGLAYERLGKSDLARQDREKGNLLGRTEQ